MPMDPKPFMLDWCSFDESSVYILMAIARRKFNEELTHNSEVVFREVVRDEDDVSSDSSDSEGRNPSEVDDIADKYNKLHTLAEASKYNFRIYLTVNARDVISAHFNFHNKMNKWGEDLYHGDDAAVEKMSHTGSRWLSELHKPRNRAETYFQFDLDDVTSADVGRFTFYLPGGIDFTIRETPNGYHVLTDTFNYTEWNAPVEYDEMDADGMVFLAEL